MLKILYISPYFPYYTKGGGGALSFNRIKSLSKFAEIDLIFLHNGEEIKEYEKEIRNYVNEFICIDQNLFTSLKNIFIYLPYKSLKESFVFSKKVVKILKKITSTKEYDIIWLNHERTFQYLFYILKGKKMVDLHDITSKRHKKIILNSKNPFWKFVHFYEFLRLRGLEKKILKVADGIIVTTEEERNKMRNKKRIYEFAFCPEIKPLNIHSKKEKIILFMGDMTYYPNIDALFYFTKEIFPHIKKLVPEAKLWITGITRNKKIKSLHNGSDIIFKGFVPSLDELYSNIRVLAVSLRIATGIRVKILESMARGVPVVSTRIGCEGIKGIKNKVNIMIGDTPFEFAKLSAELLKNDRLAEKISKEGVKLIKKYYSEERLKNIVEKILNSN